MNKQSLFALTFVAAAVLAGCSTLPDTNATLEQARSEYRQVEANAGSRGLAPAEMRQAAEALARADQALARRDSPASVEQLAYFAKQRVALAQQAGARKAAELAVAEAAGERDKLRLAARTSEADAAQARAVVAQRDARAAQSQAEASQLQAAASQRQSAASQQQAGQAEQRAQALEAQLRELDAKKTDRGMVVTIGDVLFDSGRASLKSGALSGMDRLVGFLKQHPERKAMVEGFTDSVGDDSANQALSGRRADAVRSALVTRGIGAERLGAQGYGESFPVAGNDTASGRQMNRRVEIVLSDERGAIVAR